MQTAPSRLVFVALLLALPALATAPEGAIRPASSAVVSPALQRAVGDADTADRLPVWVFLADKGPHRAGQLREAEEALTAHARARRARNRGAGNLVDAYDIPVSAAYVAALRAHSTRVRHVSRWLNAVSIDIAPTALGELAALPFVARLDLVRTGRIPLPVPEVVPPAAAAPTTRAAYSFDYGASYDQNQLINVPALHDLGYSGSGVLICMLDSGFNNLGHVAFQQIDIMVTHDFVNGDSIVSDQPGQASNSSHGTYTLSTIGGFAPGNLIGPAFGATYILAKTENADWERHIEEDAWVAGAEWADSIGADIISSSVGYSTGFTDGEPDYDWTDLDGATAICTIGADIAASRGILVVNAAGNDGLVAEPANTLIAPSDGDSVLCVGAVDGGGLRAGFSSVGLSADGRIKPDVMAMGLSVRSASPFEAEAYIHTSGTSLSCPLAAGAAALILEARPNATNAEIIAALRQTASRAATPDRLYGWGIIDAAAAIAVIPTAVRDEPLPLRARLAAYPNPFNPSTTIEYEVGARGRVTVAVFDVRGTQVATLVDGVQGPGSRTVSWDGRTANGKALASGVYLLRLETADTRLVRKLVLLK